MNRDVYHIDLGNIDFKRAWDLQEGLLKYNVEEKIRAHKEGRKAQTYNFWLLCEHNPVYTLGKSGNPENLLLSKEELAAQNIVYYHINRGGDITYHGPGQITGYPILDLDNFFTDIHKYLRYLEESVILVLADYGLTAGRIEGLTGVWLDPESPDKARKICAFGVKTSRWITMHGLGFNINSDLDFFGKIVPCGIDDKAVTSLARELGGSIDLQDVKNKLSGHLADLFEMKYIYSLPAEIEGPFHLIKEAQNDH